MDCFVNNCGVFSVLYLPPLSISYYLSVSHTNLVPIVHDKVSENMYVGLCMVQFIILL